MKQPYGICDVGFQGKQHSEAASSIIWHGYRPWHTRFSRSMVRDYLGYPDGMNSYAGYHVMHGGLDPSGLEVVTAVGGAGTGSGLSAAAAAEANLTEMGFKTVGEKILTNPTTQSLGKKVVTQVVTKVPQVLLVAAVGYGSYKVGEQSGAGELLADAWYGFETAPVIWAALPAVAAAEPAIPEISILIEEMLPPNSLELTLEEACELVRKVPPWLDRGIDPRRDCIETCHKIYEIDAKRCRNLKSKEARRKCWERIEEKNSLCIRDCNREFPTK